MLPDMLMQFITIWQSCIHASGVAKSSGKIHNKLIFCPKNLFPQIILQIIVTAKNTYTFFILLLIFYIIYV